MDANTAYSRIEFQRGAANAKTTLTNELVRSAKRFCADKA